MSLAPIPPARIAPVNDAPVRDDRDYVLYWMIAARRATSSFALQHALVEAERLGKPLLVLEALRCGYRWASERLHRFVIDGMADNAAACVRAGVRYYAYVEPALGAGRGLLAALAERACLVVTDEFPCFFLPRMVAAAGAQLDTALVQVDGNGLVPLRATPSEFATAHAFRRWLQKELPAHLAELPVDEPLARAARAPMVDVPRAVLARWPEAPRGALDSSDPEFLASLPIDHDVAPVEQRGGARAAHEALREFVADKLAAYVEDRNQPQREIQSSLSPYLHFGHIGAHEVLRAIAEHEQWTPRRLSPRASGSREGWWRMSAQAEAFLDQLVTWRELGYVFAFHRPDDYDAFASLPAWAKQTLDAHRGDAREHVYSLDEFERAATHDELWNAAQMQLVREDRIHNYLRMLWGKKIVEWSATPEDALATMIELNNKYALDGRNPNSYSGIFWVLGRFDRAWGPVRRIFGTVRWMSSANTAKKVRVADYVERYRGSRRD